eukprot:CAMPEP_0168349426 /NCGR_PEP_ID=MMETSP0213-20121227/20404_1 /TAXON_ID=151035 /ORGANISM="Euplotes harpa, Strain FSP1.4" /LENGTH=162 /DNA_ID=CAMNT_0008359355 /DNA_START=272 /DNA_END=760 /DNA_ORIENTATION=-
MLVYSPVEQVRVAVRVLSFSDLDEDPAVFDVVFSLVQLIFVPVDSLDELLRLKRALSVHYSAVRAELQDDVDCHKVKRAGVSELRHAVVPVLDCCHVRAVKPDPRAEDEHLLPVLELADVSLGCSVQTAVPEDFLAFISECKLDIFGFEQRIPKRVCHRDSG